MLQNLDKRILELSDVEKIEPQLEWVPLLTRDVAEDTQTLVFLRDAFQLKLLTTNNFPEKVRHVVDDFSKQGFTCELYYTDIAGLQYALAWYDKIESVKQEKEARKEAQEHASGKTALEMMVELFDKRNQYKTSDFVMKFISLAYQAWASDLHFQVERDWVQTRLRVDGVLHDVVRLSQKDYLQYLAKLKFISGIKINVVDLPQDGRFSFDSFVSGKKESIDVRVNTLPWLYADSIAIRFLQWLTGLSSFEDLGMRPDQVRVLTSILEKQHGMVFVTGPTWSGKTTTLYTMLHHLNDGSKKIVTLENPVEYQVSGIQQSQIDEGKGYTYEVWLKAVLRHDPDIILVWETRSKETADTVVNASLTGHMVLTTLHTNSALDTISRLLSMGVKTYFLSPVLSLICAQRLVRKICPHCSHEISISDVERKDIESKLFQLSSVKNDFVLPSLRFFEWTGCEHCNRTGFLGRTVVMELLVISDVLKSLILSSKPRDVLFEAARKEGFVTMEEDALIKVLQGITSLSEIRRIL